MDPLFQKAAEEILAAKKTPVDSMQEALMLCVYPSCGDAQRDLQVREDRAVASGRCFKFGMAEANEIVSDIEVGSIRESLQKSLIEFGVSLETACDLAAEVIH